MHPLFSFRDNFYKDHDLWNNKTGMGYFEVRISGECQDKRNAGPEPEKGIWNEENEEDRNS